MYLCIYVFMYVCIANACGDHRQPLKFRQHGSILGRKILQNQRLGPSWRRLGASWRPLGHVLGRLYPSWAVLEACWAVLGSSWGRLGAQAGRLGGQDNPKNSAKTTHDASKMPPRQPKIRFSPKKEEKMNPSSSDGIFHSILIRFQLKNAFPNIEKSLKLDWKNKQF